MADLWKRSFIHEGQRVFLRSDVENYKSEIAAAAGVVADVAEIQFDSFVPLKTLARELAVAPRTIHRRVDEASKTGGGDD